MCVENYYRTRRCGHTRFLRWDYCSVIIPKDRLPETGHACRKYKLKYKDNQENYNCFDCMRERMLMQPPHEEESARTGNREGSEEAPESHREEHRKSKMKEWFKKFVIGGFDEDRL
jgi:hypothetical protein